MREAESPGQRVVLPPGVITGVGVERAVMVMTSDTEPQLLVEVMEYVPPVVAKIESFVEPPVHK